jgi:hypothetical protein
MGRASQDGLRSLRRRLESAWSQAGAHRRRNRGAPMKAAAAGLAAHALLFATRSPMRERKIAQIPKENTCRSHQYTALADRGYFNGEQVLACEGTGISPCVPKTVWPHERGLFTRHDFIYDAENDHYTCPAGQKLTKGLVRSDRRDDVDHYRHLTACFTCSLRPKCTPDKLKRLKRWRHEHVLDKMQARLDHMPDAMGIRRQTVEHPFGTLKLWMGSIHFLTKTLAKVRTEMSLHVLAYNMKRMIQILGAGALMEAIRT